MKKNYIRFQRSTNIMGSNKDKYKPLIDKVKNIKVSDSNQFLARKMTLEEMKKAIANKKSKGGDIKPVKAVGGVLASLAMGVPLGITGAVLGAKKLKKKSSVTPSNDTKYAMNNKNMVADLYQKSTKQKTANMNVGGEVEVMKGGDYIKDLID